MYSDYDFHEAGIEKIWKEKKNLYFDLRNVTLCANEEKFDGQLVFNGVPEILTEDKVTNDIEMELTDGDIICLNKQEKHYIMVIYWSGYQPSVRKSVSYTITAESVDWTVTGKFEGY